MSTTFDRHEQCLAALPAFVVGKLSAKESAAVIAHAKTCAECSEELEFARRLHTHFDRKGQRVAPSEDGREQASFDQLWARIVADSPAPVRLVPKARRRAWVSSLAAMAATVLFAAGYIWHAVDEPQFRTLSESMRSCQALHVRVAAQTDASEVRRLLEGTGARIVDGPDAAGMYTLTAPNVADVLSEVRALSIVQSAEAKPC